MEASKSGPPSSSAAKPLLPPLPHPPVGMGRSGIVLLHMRCSTKIKVWQNRKASVKLLDLTSQGGMMKYMNLEREKRISEEVKRQVSKCRVELIGGGTIFDWLRRCG